MVGTDVVEVERRLRAGELCCPCGGGLAPWGHARAAVGPRCRRCCARAGPGAARCLVTHVLLAVSCLLRRADGVEVIGAALRAKAAGVGHRPIAARLGRPVSTVRGWLRAFAGNAETVRALFTALLVQLDPLTGPLPSPSGRVRRRGRGGRGVRCGGPAPAGRGRRGVAVAAGVGGHRRSSAGAEAVGGVDQHELALGQRRLINDPRDSCAFHEARRRS